MGEMLNYGSFRLLYSSKDAVVCRMAYLLWRTAIQKKANQNPASDLTASFRTYSRLRFGLARILSDQTWRLHKRRKGVCEHIMGLA